MIPMALIQEWGIFNFEELSDSEYVEKINSIREKYKVYEYDQRFREVDPPKGTKYVPTEEDYFVIKFVGRTGDHLLGLYQKRDQYLLGTGSQNSRQNLPSWTLMKGNNFNLRGHKSITLGLGLDYESLDPGRVGSFTRNDMLEAVTTLLHGYKEHDNVTYGSAFLILFGATSEAIKSRDMEVHVRRGLNITGVNKHFISDRQMKINHSWSKISKRIRDKSYFFELKYKNNNGSVVTETLTNFSAGTILAVINTKDGSKKEKREKRKGKRIRIDSKDDEDDDPYHYRGKKRKNQKAKSTAKPAKRSVDAEMKEETEIKKNETPEDLTEKTDGEQQKSKEDDEMFELDDMVRIPRYITPREKHIFSWSSAFAPSTSSLDSDSEESDCESIKGDKPKQDITTAEPEDDRFHLDDMVRIPRLITPREKHMFSWSSAFAPSSSSSDSDSSSSDSDSEESNDEDSDYESIDLGNSERKQDETLVEPKDKVLDSAAKTKKSAEYLVKHGTKRLTEGVDKDSKRAKEMALQIEDGGKKKTEGRGNESLDDENIDGTKDLKVEHGTKRLAEGVDQDFKRAREMPAQTGGRGNDTTDNENTGGS